VRLDGDEMPPDADDGDAGHATGTYIWIRANPARTASFESRTGRGETSQNCAVQPLGRLRDRATY
jgi:hypothetical protein